ncbi:MAG: prepilin peptidase [Acidobacteria bacterium]|nr:prepilin peptidase [Acidobacteriota bacterium]MBI3278227.1 prepilin peptidase [Acidobacteriota bacterium]
MLEPTLAGLFGLLIGSFLNVCIYRLPRDLSVVRPRSFCPSCDKQIAWFDNVPVLTYLWLRGRCRHCGAHIPVRYPLVELLTGVLFFFTVQQAGLSAPAVKYCTFFAIQVTLLFSDLETRILPDEFTLGGLAAGFVFAAVAPMKSLLLTLVFPHWSPLRVSLTESIAAAVITSAALWAIGALYKSLRGREGMGMGDIKMVAMIGAFLGLQGALFTLALGSILGSVIGLIFVFFARKKASQYELPFGSFLAAAAVLVGVQFLRGVMGD